VKITEPTLRSRRSERVSRSSSRTISAVMKLCGGWSIRTVNTRPSLSAASICAIGEEPIPLRA
jgi:hypothetical protein